MSWLQTIIATIILMSTCMAKNVLDSDWESITEEVLSSDPLIEVEGTSKHFNIDEYELTHLKFQESGKNKRKAYLSFIKKYGKITSGLIKYHVIPNEAAMIHTNIQMNFNNKKKMWEFSRVFVVYSNDDQLNQVLQSLQQFKLVTLKERPVMGYLNEKLLAIKAFQSAKSKLQKFLNKKLNSKLQIIYVVDIEIKGKKFIHEQDIEVQIKKQNNFSKEKNDMVQTTDSKIKTKTSNNNIDDIPDDDAVVKVLFKVGNINDPNNDTKDDEEDLSDNSEGDGDQGEENSQVDDEDL